MLPIGGARHARRHLDAQRLLRLSAAAAGIALDNIVLIVTGMIVGASGAILTMQMAEAMNRSIGNVFFAGFGTEGGPRWPTTASTGTAKSTSAADVAILLSYARLA